MSELIVPQAVFDAIIDAIAERVADKLEERNPLPQPLPDNTTFDLEEAAEYLGSCVDFIRRKVRSGELQGFKKGKWFVYKKSVDEWMKTGGST